MGSVIEGQARPIRLADIARAAGVSHGTASNVFSRPEIVRPEVRERVKAVSGQTQVPVLVDTDRKKVVIESEEIIEYLARHYGRKET